jgi:hypothetical protein
MGVKTSVMPICDMGCLGELSLSISTIVVFAIAIAWLNASNNDQEIECCACEQSAEIINKEISNE